MIVLRLQQVVELEIIFQNKSKVDPKVEQLLKSPIHNYIQLIFWKFLKNKFQFKLNWPELWNEYTTMAITKTHPTLPAAFFIADANSAAFGLSVWVPNSSANFSTLDPNISNSSWIKWWTRTARLVRSVIRIIDSRFFDRTRSKNHHYYVRSWILKIKGFSIFENFLRTTDWTKTKRTGPLTGSVVHDDESSRWVTWETNLFIFLMNF